MNRSASGYRIAVTAVVLLLCKLSPLTHGQAVEQSRIEAAMTLQLLSFTEWKEVSEESLTPIDIGVFEDAATLEIFRSLIQNKPHQGLYALHSITASSSAEELNQLDVLYFSHPDPTEIPRILRRIEAQPIVLIGSFDGFLEIGGMVNFVKRQRRLGFEIDVTRSKDSGIEYRAKLLRLANRIVE